MERDRVKSVIESFERSASDYRIAAGRGSGVAALINTSKAEAFEACSTRLAEALSDAEHSELGRPIRRSVRMSPPDVVASGIKLGSSYADMEIVVVQDITAKDGAQEKSEAVDRGTLINDAAPAGAAVVDARERLARTPQKNVVEYERARVALLGTETRKAAADAALGKASS